MGADGAARERLERLGRDLAVELAEDGREDAAERRVLGEDGEGLVRREVEPLGADGAGERLGAGGRGLACADLACERGDGLGGRGRGVQGERTGGVGGLVRVVAQLLVGRDLGPREEVREVAADSVEVEGGDEEDRGDVGHLGGADFAHPARQVVVGRPADGGHERLHRRIDLLLGRVLAQGGGERGEGELAGRGEERVEVEVLHLVLREQPFLEFGLSGGGDRERVGLFEDGGAFGGEALRLGAERLLDLGLAFGGDLPIGNPVLHGSGQALKRSAGKGRLDERGGGDAGLGGHRLADHPVERLLAARGGLGAADFRVDAVLDGRKRGGDLVRARAGGEAPDEVRQDRLEDVGHALGIEAGCAQLGAPPLGVLHDRLVRRALAGGAQEGLADAVGRRADVLAQGLDRRVNRADVQEVPGIRLRARDVRAEDGADVREDVGGERLERAEAPLAVAGEGHDDLLVEVLDRARGDVGLGGRRFAGQIAGRCEHVADRRLRCALRQLRQIDQKRLRGRVREVVHEIEALVVRDARVLQERDDGGADLPALAAQILRQGGDPLGAPLGGKRAEFFAEADDPRVRGEAFEPDDHVLQLARPGRLVHPRVHRERLDLAVSDRDPGRNARARMAAGLLDHDVERRVGHFEEFLPVSAGPEVHVARHERLEERDAALLRDRPARVEGGVDRLARGGARLALPRRDAGVELVARANRLRTRVSVDRGGVAVEDLADLLARERPDRAVLEGGVHGLVRPEPELAADARDLVRADAALRERLDERLLDREDLGVGELGLVLARRVDVVVDLVEGGFARKLHLAGVVFAVRDGLELLEGDVDVGEVDGHGWLLRRVEKLKG